MGTSKVTVNFIDHEISKLPPNFSYTHFNKDGLTLLQVH